MTTLPVETIGTIIAALLTFFVFSYLLGDLPGIGAFFKFFYRLAVHVLIGAGVGYAFAVALNLLFVRVFVRLTEGSFESNPFKIGIAIAGAALGGLLLFKGIRRLAWVGNIATGYLVGVGLGVAVGGALVGTIVAQTRALAGMQDAALLIGLFGTLCTLVAFSFTATARRGILGVLSRIVQAVAVLGRGFIYIALGAAFAGAYAASVAVLVGRLQFLINAIGELVLRFSGG